jgi:hypothetical protein
LNCQKTKMRQNDENELEPVCQLPVWQLAILQTTVMIILLFVFIIAPAVLLLVLFKEYTIILIVMVFIYLKFTEIVPECETISK